MSLTVSIKVIPNSGKQKCILDKNNQIKIYLKSQPERGLANKELVQFLSKKLEVSQLDIEIISGLTSRNKKLKINKDIGLNQVLILLNLEVQVQQDIFKKLEK